MKILVKSDVYNICNRIKKFDSSYRIVFNTMSNNYEVYSTNLTSSVELVGGVVLSYVCVLPYKQLDERVIKYLYDTSVNNFEKILADIDKQNEQLEYSNELKLKHNTLNIMENKLRQLT